jgi:hypothetical protein
MKDYIFKEHFFLLKEVTGGGVFIKCLQDRFVL